MKNTAADPVESLLSINQEAIFIMCVTIAPQPRSAAASGWLMLVPQPR